MIRGGGAEKMIGDGMINGISKRAASTVDVEKKGADSKKVMNEGRGREEHEILCSK